MKFKTLLFSALILLLPELAYAQGHAQIRERAFYVTAATNINLLDNGVTIVEQGPLSLELVCTIETGRQQAELWIESTMDGWHSVPSGSLYNLPMDASRSRILSVQDFFSPSPTLEGPILEAVEGGRFYLAPDGSVISFAALEIVIAPNFDGPRCAAFGKYSAGRLPKRSGRSQRPPF